MKRYTILPDTVRQVVFQVALPLLVLESTLLLPGAAAPDCDELSDVFVAKDTGYG